MDFSIFRPTINYRRAALLTTAAIFSSPALAQTGGSTGCSIGEVTTLPITFAYGDTIPTIPVTIAGQSVAGILDTGSRVTTFYRKTLEKAGVPVRATETNYVDQQILVANIPSLSLGPVSTKGYFPVIEKDIDSIGELGANLLARHDVEIWWAGGQFSITRPKGCRNAYLASWAPDAHVVPFETDQSGDDMRAWFKAKINGRTVNTVIATKNSISLMDLHTAARYGITPQSPGAVEEAALPSWRNQRQRVWRVPVPDMTIGPYRVQNAVIRIMDLTLSGEMMSLGADFLRNHRMLISMSQQRIYLSHLGGPSFSDAPPVDHQEKTSCQASTCAAAPE